MSKTSPVAPFSLKEPQRALFHKSVIHENIPFHTLRMPVLPSTPLIGKILILHGWGEHLGMYLRLMEFLTGLGYECFAFDQRGSGQTSPGKYRGRVGRGARTIFIDVDRMVEEAFFLLEQQLDTSLTYHMLGHSMGGGLSLSYAAEGKYRDIFNSIIVTGPLLKISEVIEPSVVVLTVLQMVAYWVPNFVYALDAESDKSAITTSKEWQQYLREDVLCKGVGTLGQLSNMIFRGAHLLSLATTNKAVLPKHTRLLMLHLRNDTITSFTASRQFYDHLNVKNKKFVEHPTGAHALFIETDEVFQEVKAHIKEFLEQKQ